MISMTLHQAASVTGATLIGKSIQFRGVSTDSRQSNKGRLFFALKGERFNGEDYALDAEKSGAAAIVSTRSLDVSCPQLIVKDSLEALSVLAKNWGKQCSAKKIGITGSNGKTTVKNMLKSILARNHRCFATQGNFNNEIGVPLSLCSLSKDDDFAILEMGAAEVGDIQHLVSLVDLDAAAITGISAAHIGRFGSIENIAKGKSEIFSNLNDGIAVINHDDSFFQLMSDSAKGKKVSFGKNDSADVQILNSQGFQLRIKHQEKEQKTSNIELPAPGAHNQYNAAAAASLAISVGISINDVVEGLQNFEPEAGRLQNLGTINQCQVINDSYNANPASMKAAIDVLAQIDGVKTLILGDMGELGDEAEKMHQDIGEYALNNCIDNLIAIGKFASAFKQGFGAKTTVFANKEQAAKHLKNHWQTLGTVLFKASRSMQLETLINEIKALENAA